MSEGQGPSASGKDEPRPTSVNNRRLGVVRDLAWARFLATLGMSLERTSDMTLPNMLVDERQSNIEKALKEIALKERRRVREAEFAKLSDEEQEQLLVKC